MPNFGTRDVIIVSVQDKEVVRFGFLRILRYISPVEVTTKWKRDKELSQPYMASEVSNFYEDSYRVIWIIAPSTLLFVLDPTSNKTTMTSLHIPFN
jgi:hypothetical protein